jgi:UDP-GlcNAc:undecaprenyl-phosphate GlcNAc-1-phosphate transferase
VEPILLAMVAAAVAYAVTPVARRIALRVGAVDEPRDRHVHTAPTPRFGGIAVAAGLLGAAGLGGALGAPLASQAFADAARMWGLGTGALLVLAVGILDDVRGVSPAAKLVVQAVAATAAFGGGYAMAGVTNPFTGTYVVFGWVGVLLTIAWVVAITNAFNLIDGLDGLAAGVALIAAVPLLTIAWIEGRLDVIPLWALLAGTLAGFLVHNFAPASIFLGDSGSLLVGYLIALFSLQALEKSATVILVLASCLALGVPIIDVALAVARRTATSGFRGITRGDRAHLHHRLLRADATSHRSAVLVLYGIAVACGATAVVAALTQNLLYAVIVLVAAACAALLVRRRGRAA